MRVELLKSVQEKGYENFLLSGSDTLLYGSIKYRNFLCKILGNATPVYLIAIDNDQIVGALPAFIKETSKYGCVLNSLPFYGSNGGIITAPNLTDGHSVKYVLIKAYNELAEQYNVKASTIITNPFDSDIEIYDSESRYTHLDQRIGSITYFPSTKDENWESALMLQFHQKTRNMVKKGIKSGFFVTHSPDKKVLDWLYETHVENIHAIGGIAKSKNIFQAIQDTFQYGKDYKVYVAQKDSQYVAALLLFYYNQCVEYFIPVISKEHRETQVLSLIIYTAMLDSIREGYLYWNWGGTWLSQTSVYHFKKRWGSVNLPYYYYTRLRDIDLLNMNRAELLSNFQYFYLFPF